MMSVFFFQRYCVTSGGWRWQPATSVMFSGLNTPLPSPEFEAIYMAGCIRQPFRNIPQPQLKQLAGQAADQMIRGCSSLCDRLVGYSWIYVDVEIDNFIVIVIHRSSWQLALQLYSRLQQGQKCFKKKRKTRYLFCDDYALRRKGISPNELPRDRYCLGWMVFWSVGRR